MFSVYDSKAQVYAHPFCSINEASAARMFGDWCRDVNTPLGIHPDDYRLYYIGEFDSDSGSVSPVAFVTICDGAAFKGGPRGVANVVS